MAIRKPPIYTMVHGIEVLAEYPPNARCPYWRLRIRPHRFFPNSKEYGGAILVRRSRAIMSAELGRAMDRNEHVHHKSGDRADDRPENLEVLWAAEHNRHHKLGSKHSEEAKAKISRGLSSAYADGLRDRVGPPAYDWTGRQHSDETKAKMSTTRKELIASGAIAKPIPPSPTGNKHSTETKARMRKARLAYWDRRRNNADNHRGA